MAPLTVAVFVGTRADLGPLSPVIEALQASEDISLRVLTGVMYAADDLAAALPSSATAEHWRDVVVQLAPPMTAVTAQAQLDQGAELTRAAGVLLPELGIDVLVVLGDRWELLYVVPPAFLLGIPVVHLHGGEVTEGAVDERVRHAVTKLADHHCVASPDAADRLRQLGEPDDRIHVTGAPGLDRLFAATPSTDADLAGLLGVDAVERPVALFTYHPPTAQVGAPVGDWAREAAEATLAVCGTVVATYPGMDAGRDDIIQELTELADREPRVRLVEALGRDYPGVLGAVDVVVGNSSSGVIEAATLHIPAVDIGDRQRGRLRGENVVHAGEGRTPVEAAVREAVSEQGRARARTVVNPYGTGAASAEIVDIVREAAHAPRVKRFVDRPVTPPPGGTGTHGAQDLPTKPRTPSSDRKEQP
ncbi:UDP-N-acetylglucosamine 2-epimerase [Intrasporangium mesophilum]